jgi:putative metallopeptidase
VPRTKRFRQEAVPVKFTRSEEVEAVARRVIASDEVGLGALYNLNLGYVLIENRKAPDGPVDRWIRMVKAPPLWKALAEFDGILAVVAEKWHALTSQQQDAATYHALLHVVVNDKGALTLDGHDVEGFTKEVRRFGAWQAEIGVFGEQLGMFAVKSNGAAQVSAGLGDDEDLRPTGEVNTDALRADAARSVVDDSTSLADEADKRLRKRSRDNGRPQPPAQLS